MKIHEGYFSHFQSARLFLLVEELTKAIRSIDFIIDRSKFISRRKVDRVKLDRSYQDKPDCDRTKCDRSTLQSIDRFLRLLEDQIFQDLLNSLCNSNHKLDFVDRNGRRLALNTWLELTLDGLL